MTTPRIGALGLLSATGNMLYRDSAGRLTELDTAGASNGDVIQRVAGVPAWVTPAFAPTKELWVPVETNINYPGFNYRSRGVNGTGAFNYNFPVPRDFNAITALELIGAPNADFTGIGNVGVFNLDSNYGADGAAVNATTEASAGETVVGLQDTYLVLDLEPVFNTPGPVAGDRCGVNVNHISGMGTTTNWMWVRLRYT